MELEPNERLEYRRLPGLPGVEVLVAEHCSRRWRVFHETYSICSLLDLRGGTATWTYRGRTHESPSGGLMLIEPGETHANPTPLPRPGDFRAVFVAPELAERAAEELGMSAPRPHFKQAHSVSASLFRAFECFHAALEEPAAPLELDSRFAECLRLLLRDCSEAGVPTAQPGGRAGLLRARDFITERHAGPIRLGELAAIAGMSRYHLVREFVRAFGIPPHAYQLAVQVQRAKALLAAGCPPTVAAAEAGFADQSHMGRHFKRVLGVTPGGYRKNAVHAPGVTAHPR